MPNPNFTTEELEIGRVFEGKYRIVRELGRGGFGMVYLAHQEAMDRQVALKVLKSGLGEQRAKAKQRFLREVRVISSLRHPNTVTIHDFGENQAGILYMVLEYIEGEGLDSIIQREGAQQPDRALHFGMQIARSLAEAHRHGVVHRDLKPANIMVTRLETEGDFVKVLDFGVARLLKSENKDLTQVGLEDKEREVLGTPRYMSPEQVRGHTIDGRSDIYCLGLLLYEMLVGEPAVQGDTSMALITQHISPEPLALEGLRGLPDNIARIVRRCATKNANERYDSAEVLVRDLRKVTSMLGKEPHTESGASSGSMPAASMSFEGNNDPFITDYQAQLSDIQHEEPHAAGRSAGDSWDPQPETPNGPQSSIQHQNNGREGGGAEFGSSDQFSRTEPRDRADGAFGDMPPPPDDDDEFFPEPETEPAPESEHRSSPEDGSVHSDQAKQRERDVLLNFALDTAKILFLGTLAVFGVYVSFILIGTMFGEILSGQMRILGTLALCLAIPVLTALGETSDRERFRVVRRRINKVARALIATAILSFGSGTLVALAMPNTVVTELQSNPNWFLSGATSDAWAGQTNRKVSQTFAEIIAETTSALGIYNPAPSGKKRQKPATPKPSGPPPPTRPSVGGQQADGPDDESDDKRPSRSAIELLKNPPPESDDESGNDKGEESNPEGESRTGSGSYEEW